MGAGLLQRTPAAFHFYQSGQFLLCLLLTLLPTLFMGLSLPLAAAAAGRRLPRLASQVGGVFGLNCLGGAAGAAAAGLWLLPALGLERLILAVAAVNLVLAAALLAALAGRGLRLAALGAAAGSAGVLVYAWAAPGWDRLVLAAGEFRWQDSYEPVSYQAYRDRFKKEALLFCKDDSDATITVSREEGSLVLKTNGKTDASTVSDLNTEVLLAQLPLALRPQAQDVLVVGLGSGITAGSALTHPIRSLDLVEISRGVVEAEGFFQGHNGRPLQDPRLALHVEDAATFLRAAPRRYDLIVSEPSNPWIAGVGDLFSADFYLEARRHLAPGGLMAQWVHLYEMSDETLRLILRTFCSQFERVELWEIPPSRTDVLLIGSAGPAEPDFQAMETRLRRPAVARDLARLGIGRLTTLLSLQAAGDGAVRAAAGAGRINEEQFPILEYAAPKDLFLGGGVDLLSSWDERPRRPGPQPLELSRYLAKRGRDLSADEFQELSEFQRKSGGDAARLLLAEWERRYPADPRPLWSSAQLSSAAGDQAGALALLERYLLLRPDDAQALDQAARIELELHLQSRSFLTADAPQRALARLRRLAAATRGARQAQVLLRLAEVYANTGSLAEAEGFIARAAQAAAGQAAAPAPDSIWVAGARMALDRGDRRAARSCLEKALRLNPRNAQARALLPSVP
ncbi:MAG: hypothetical protein PHU21_04200, partial [Elusimicrobia bacterium]|nr:hypothetical protein [Elusimicrobiota bacterium]